MVKRSRRRPLTPQTGVRFSHGSPQQKARLYAGLFSFIRLRTGHPLFPGGDFCPTCPDRTGKDFFAKSFDFILTFLQSAGILIKLSGDMARWSSGQDGGLSRRKREFDSPTGHHSKKLGSMPGFFLLYALCTANGPLSALHHADGTEGRSYFSGSSGSSPWQGHAGTTGAPGRSLKSQKPSPAAQVFSL